MEKVAMSGRAYAGRAARTDMALPLAAEGGHAIETAEVESAG
jgi:hypothetical protein